jgi:hypothetical protein
MFPIERKIVHVGVKKIIMLYYVQVYIELENLSFTFPYVEDNAQLQKNGKNIFICILIIKLFFSECGAAAEY